MQKILHGFLKIISESVWGCTLRLFIYAGSNRHILENMFNYAAKPFYNSAEQIYLVASFVKLSMMDQRQSKRGILNM